MKLFNSRLYKINFYTIMGIILLPTACSDFINIDPPITEVVTQTAFESDASATSAIRGIYSLMMTNTSFTNGGMEEYTGIASDELTSYATRIDQLQFFQNSITPKNGDLPGIFWREPYKYINNANTILEGMKNSSGMTVGGKKQLEGEARFIRAFCHFYLTVLFGDVPYITTTDYKDNAKASRNPSEEVFSNVEKDLLIARDYLSADFSFSGGERIQPNKGAATALLAKLYLHLGNWEKAEAMATDLISNSASYSLVTDLNKVFLANSLETIWQLKPVVPSTNSPQGAVFILAAAPNGISRRVSMTTALITAFETNDQRKSKWTAIFSNATGSWPYIFKYKVNISSTLTEYSMIFRLGEQYLIRAEARARLQNTVGSKSDLNAIRNRAGLANTSANDQASLLDAIIKERRIELCGEFGNRWLDLKRLGIADAILTSLKSQWQSSDQLFPIPDSERLLDPNLSQNPGY